MTSASRRPRRGRILVYQKLRSDGAQRLQTIIDNGSARYMNVVKVGEPIGAFYGAEYAGVDPANGDALWYINASDASGNIPDPDATTNYFPDANFVVLA